MMATDYSAKFEEGMFYHVYNRTNGSEKLFVEEKNYSHFLMLWKRYLSNYLDTYSYSLMPNHFHFVVKVKPDSDRRVEAIKRENTIAASNFLNNEIDLNTFLEKQFQRL